MTFKYIHVLEACIKKKLKKKIEGMVTGKTVEGCCFYFRSEEFMNPEFICFFQIDVY